MKIKLQVKKALAAFLVAVPMMVSAQTYPIAINEENFPDENFRNYLIDFPIGYWDDINYVRYEVKMGADGLITKEEIEQVYIISVVGMNISSLKGIEYFTNLGWLSCDVNQLTSLDVSKNTHLYRLTCSNNQLTSLDVSKNTDLEVLYCDNNQLTSLDISNNTKLTALWCMVNQLVSLDVSRNTMLTDLECQSNELTSLTVSSNTVLANLACGYNKLTSLDVSNTKLTELWCEKNQLQGDKMNDFIASLPKNTSGTPYHIYIYDNREGDEGNICTKKQVSAIKEKGWTPYYYYYEYIWQWKEYEGSLETAEVTITEAEYAAYITTFDVDFTQTVGLTAYKVTNATTSSVTLEAITSAPAGTAVILYGEAGTYELLETEDEINDITDNLFMAGGDISSDGKTIYALAEKENGVGFYLVAEGVAVPANKGYLVIDSEASEVKTFIPFGDGATGINSVAKSATEGAIYNLAGQRITAPTQNGIYIMNGKKVFINK